MAADIRKKSKNAKNCNCSDDVGKGKIDKIH